MITTDGYNPCMTWDSSPSSASGPPTGSVAATVGPVVTRVLDRDPGVVPRIVESAAFRPEDGAGGSVHWAELATDLASTLLVAASGQTAPSAVEQHARHLGTIAHHVGFPADGPIRLVHGLIREVRASADDWSSSVSSGVLAYYQWVAACFGEGVAEAGRSYPGDPSPEPEAAAAPTPAAASPPPPAPPPPPPQEGDRLKRRTVLPDHADSVWGASARLADEAFDRGRNRH